MKIPGVLLSVIDKAVNRYLSLDSAVSQRLALQCGKFVAVELRGWDICFYIEITADGVVVVEVEPEKIDTWLIGTPVSLLSMALAKEAQDSEKLLFSGDVEIKGDIELGQELKKIFSEIDIDLEEQLSKITGDVIAHQVGNLARAGKAWSKKTAQTLELDVAEYFQEESRQLPIREEVEQFMSDVDLTRAGVDRIEARVNRLLNVSELSG